MVHLHPVPLDEKTVAVAVTVELPKTRLIAISTSGGYIMCGALDVALLDTRFPDRRVVAGRALGVRSWEDLLNAPLADVTQEAEALGIHPGMSGRDALLHIAETSQAQAAAR